MYLFFIWHLELMILMRENSLLGTLEEVGPLHWISRIKINMSHAIKTTGTIICKGTESPDGLGFSWHIWIELGLKKGRGWFLNFLGAPSIIH